jgi:hypothetical protein
MPVKFYDDYPTVPIGGGNPYHMCASCGRSVPEINGYLHKHDEWCDYRKSKESNQFTQELLEEVLEHLTKISPLVENHAGSDSIVNQHNYILQRIMEKF